MKLISIQWKSHKINALLKLYEFFFKQKISGGEVNNIWNGEHQAPGVIINFSTWKSGLFYTSFN